MRTVQPPPSESPPIDAQSIALFWEGAAQRRELGESTQFGSRLRQAEWFSLGVLVAVPFLIALFGFMAHLLGGVAEQPYPQ